MLHERCAAQGFVALNQVDALISLGRDKVCKPLVLGALQGLTLGHGRERQRLQTVKVRQFFKVMVMSIYMYMIRCQATNAHLVHQKQIA